MKRTKAIELIENAQVLYELKEFDAEEYTAKEASEKLGIPLEIVFKTLVCKGDKKGVVMVVIPARKELNLKKLAEVLGDKRCDLLPVADMQRLTGYLKGGCSPLGSKKNMVVYIDHSATFLPQICVSAGLRGLQVLINPYDLQKLSNGSFVDLCL